MSISRSNLICLIMGAAVGIGGAFVAMPSSKNVLKATTTDRTSKFAVATAPADLVGEAEAVFVLDFLNGTIVGGVMNNQRNVYTHRYYRLLGADFGVDPNTPEPEYAIVGTKANLRGNGASKGIIHIAEKSSGKIIAYGFTYPNQANPNQPLPLTPLDFIQFRDAVQ